MDDLIKRQDAIDACLDGFCACVNDCVNEIKKLPSAQKTGKWLITDAYPHNVHCSNCHMRFAQTHWIVWEDGSLPRNFCPNCGARMECEEE